MNLMPADTYIVINDTILEEKNREILFMLYQPLIGSISINLYFTFWSNLDSLKLITDVYSHHDLMALTGLTLDVLLESREKLEGIGLIKTFIKKGTVNEYVYRLYSPLSAHDFLVNPVLSTALLGNVGVNSYEKLTTYFKKPLFDTREYEDITVSFSDIFKFSKGNMVSEIPGSIKRTNHQDLKVVSNIDFNNVFSRIPPELLSYEDLTTDTKDYIMKMCFAYDLNDNNLVSLIVNSTENRALDRDRFRGNVVNFSRFDNDLKDPILMHYTQPEFLKTNVRENSKLSRMIHVYENTTPHDFLDDKFGGGSINKYHMSVLEYLLVEMDLKPGVVNVLIDYVLRINENKLIKNFVDRIASDWKLNKIETVPSAIEYAKNENKKRSEWENNAKIGNKVGKTVRSSAPTPEWFDKKFEEEEVSEDELNKMREFLNS